MACHRAAVVRLRRQTPVHCLGQLFRLARSSKEEEAQQSHQALIGLIAAWLKPNILLASVLRLKSQASVFLWKKCVFVDFSV